MAQRSSLGYPSARRADGIDDNFGTKVADPYRWMEDLNSPELKQWIDAENALAFGYLDALPQRDALKARITELWNYPKVTPPRYEGSHWFYSRGALAHKSADDCEHRSRCARNVDIGPCLAQGGADLLNLAGWYVHGHDPPRTDDVRDHRAVRRIRDIPERQEGHVDGRESLEHGKVVGGRVGVADVQQRRCAADQEADVLFGRPPGRVVPDAKHVHGNSRNIQERPNGSA